MIAKIEWHPDELFPRVGFIVTNLPMEPDWVVRFYNQRGTAEQHIKEGKYAFRWTRLSCRKFRDNEVRLQLHALAYNLATFLRCIELPEAMADWSLTSLQLKLIKIGVRVVRHARTITQLAEVAVNGPMVRAILHAIRRLRNASVMRMTAIHVQTERKQQDRYARCDEKHPLPGQNTAVSRSDPPSFRSLRDRRRRSGRKNACQADGF